MRGTDGRFARHSHCCARAFVLSRHNDIKNDLCDFAREAGLQPLTEQFAAEIPPEHLTATGGARPRRSPTRHADARIEAELGEVVTWIDVNITATGQRRYGDWITKLAGKLLGGAETAKFNAWRLTPDAQVGGRLVRDGWGRDSLGTCRGWPRFSLGSTPPPPPLLNLLCLLRFGGYGEGV